MKLSEALVLAERMTLGETVKGSQARTVAATLAIILLAIWAVFWPYF
jgi:hypothetical protein